MAGGSRPAIASRRRRLPPIAEPPASPTIQQVDELSGLSPDVASWIAKSGAEHYAQQLPRLRE
jgi:hypothetical protein